MHKYLHSGGKIFFFPLHFFVYFPRPALCHKHKEGVEDTMHNALSVKRIIVRFSTGISLGRLEGEGHTEQKTFLGK